MVFMKGVTAKAAVRDRAENFISELHDTVDECGFVTDTSISIGIAQAPEDGTVFKKLYNCADKALYYVKRNGKNSYHFFSDKLQGENERNKETVDLKYLQERMDRTDSGNGAYLLDIESFLYVYNFVRRFINRNNQDVTMLLFTMDEANIAGMDLLEKTICTYLRRSDVTTRYSSRQLVVILMDANSENSSMVAERIIENFNKAYSDEAIHIDYSVARVDS